MKKFLLLLSVVALTFTGCYEDLGPEEPNVNEIQLSQSYFEVPSAGGNFNVTVRSDYPWNAFTSESWITLNNVYGDYGVSYLSFTVAPNSSSNMRTGCITIGCDSYNLVAEIRIDQYGGATSSDVAFDIQVGTVTDTTAQIAVIPSDYNATYYWDIFDAQTVASLGLYEFMVAYHQMLQEAISENGLSWADVVYKGEGAWTYEGLNPATDYVAFAFVVDASTGALMSNDLSYTVFTTKDSTSSTVDISSWLASRYRKHFWLSTYQCRSSTI